MGNQITANYVIKNQSQNRSRNISGALTKNMTHGFSFKGGFNYGVSRSLVEPSSTAGSSWGSAQPDRERPEQPGAGLLAELARQAHLLRGELHRSSTSAGARPPFSVFYDGHTNGNTSYVFAGDANGDTVSAATT